MKIIDKDIIEKGILCLVFAIIIYSVLVLYGDIKSVLSYLSSTHLTEILSIILLTVSSLFLRFLRWEYYLRIQNIYLNKLESFLFFIIGFSMTLTPGKIGESIKCYLMKKDKDITFSNSLAIVVAERGLDLFSLTLIAFGSYFFMIEKYLNSLLATLIGLVVAYLGLKHIKLLNKLIKQILILDTIEAKFENLKTSIDTKEKLKKPKTHSLPLVYSYFSWILNGASLYILLIGFDNASFSASLAAFSTSSIAGALSMIPGGLGIVEGSMSGTLQLFGIPKTPSIASTIILRIFSFWFVFAGGVLALIYYVHTRS